jgi:hypothetical protein
MAHGRLGEQVPDRTVETEGGETLETESGVTIITEETTSITPIVATLLGLDSFGAARDMTVY